MNQGKTARDEGKAELIVDARWLREHRDGARLILIDTRPVKDFHGGHLSGARHFDPFAFHHTDTSERGIAEFARSSSGYFRRWESPAARPSCFTRMNPECARREASGRSNTRDIQRPECSTADSRRPVKR